jgi:oligosaccharide 4-alpha-D-glucosyltransferase
MRKFLRLLFISLGIVASAMAQESASLNGFVSSSYNGKQLLVKAANGYISIVPYNADVVEVTYLTQPTQNVVSYSTIGKPGNTTATYKDNGATVSLTTATMRVVVDKKDLAIYFITKKGDTLSAAKNYGSSKDQLKLDFSATNEEAFYGGGSRAVELNKRGQVLENYNQAHFGYRFGQANLNTAIPFLVSSKHYGLYIDNYAKSKFDIAKTNSGKVTFSTIAGAMRFYFIAGSSTESVIGNYTYLTGRQPLPPRWAMGYISSRFGYKSEREIMNVVDQTQKAGIPLDGVVFDLYWYKEAALMGNQNWSRDSFPNPQLMLSNLQKRGIRVVPISETYITKKSENFAFANDHNLFATSIVGNGQPYIFPRFWAGAAGLLDIFKPEAQQFYWGMYKDRIKEGIAGWWFDLGEPEKVTDSLVYALGPENEVHNLYGMTWIKTAFDGYRKDFPQSRVFILSRSGFAGMQRYSTFPWSGDITRSYDGLKAQIPVMVNMGLSGIGYMHSDAGGFTGANTRDRELYSRWLEFAAFTPVMRTHAETNRGGYAPEPIFWDDTTKTRVAEYIKLRYRLLPYNYTMAYQNTISGRPLMLPVNYFDGENKRLENINDEYLWGSQMLVAPVIVKGQTRKKVIFPKGDWIGFNDLQHYQDSAEVDAPIDVLPLFVKAGSIIPMLTTIVNTDQYDGKNIQLKYYSGNKTEVRSEWFYDDGTDPNSLAKNQYSLVNFVTSSTGNTHRIVISAKHTANGAKTFQLEMPGKKIKTVNFSNKTVYKTIGDTVVTFTWDGKPLALTVETL